MYNMDFDGFDLRMRLPAVVGILHDAVKRNGGVAYIHCTAGMGRAPVVAAKMVAIMASFIIHKAQERTTFMKTSLRNSHWRTGAFFLLKHRKDYVDMYRMTEQERDSIEHKVSDFIKLCQKQINILKASINDEEATWKGWLGIKKKCKCGYHRT